MRWLGGIIIVLVAGCAGPRAIERTGEPLTGSAQTLAGLRAAPALEARFGGVEHDAAAEARLSRALARLAPAIPDLPACRLQLLGSREVNAMSLPGGLIYVTRGLYDRLDSDNLLAAVLAHEIAHICLHDHSKPRCDTLDASLQREMSADAQGVVYLQAVDVDPEALSQVILLIADVQPPDWVQQRRAAIRKASLHTSDIASR